MGQMVNKQCDCTDAIGHFWRLRICKKRAQDNPRPLPFQPRQHVGHRRRLILQRSVPELVIGIFAWTVITEIHPNARWHAKGRACDILAHRYELLSPMALLNQKYTAIHDGVFLFLFTGFHVWTRYVVGKRCRNVKFIFTAKY